MSFDPRVPFSRRTLLGAAASAPAAGWMRVRSVRDLPTPALAKPRILRFVAGIRPCRRGGIRIERERVGEKVVVHNYGHGGAGMTLSWGSAEEAVALVAAARPEPGPVAVLGAGAVGLATAAVLQEKGYRVGLYAADFPPHTTSNVSGAVWHPGSLRLDTEKAHLPRYDRIVRRSWQRFAALAGDETGVALRPYFEIPGDTDGAADATLPIGFEKLPRLPFAGGDRPGYRGESFQIQPPVYMAELFRRVLKAGARAEQRAFEVAGDLTSLAEPVVVDCMGLGGGAVFGDKAMVPTRGQLVHLFPEPLPYMIVGVHGYLFPRADAVVLGGTFEDGITDPEPDAAACRDILARHRAFFGV